MWTVDKTPAFIGTFALDTNALSSLLQLKQQQRGWGPGGPALATWPAHCLDLPFLGALTVPGAIRPTQGGLSQPEGPSAACSPSTGL